MRHRRWMFLAASALLATMLASAPAAQAGRHPDRPSRVLIIMLDQARPDTIERYGMKNVQALMKKGTSFPNALVGHMAAETVVSHNVITSGQFPKHMGWSNEVHRDVDGVLGTPGDFYVTSSLTCTQFKALIEHGGYRKLPDYLDDRFGESSKFVSIAQKRTAVCPAGPTSSPPATVRPPIPRTSSCRSAAARRRRATAGPASGWRPEDANRRPRRTSTSRQPATAGGPGRAPMRTAPARSCRRASTRSRATASCPGASASSGRRHVVGRRRDSRDPERPCLARHAREPRRRSTRSGHMWGPRTRRRAARLGSGDAPPAVRREDG